MPLSPLRPPAAPIQDAPRKISSPLQSPAAKPTTTPSTGSLKTGSVTRPSNPAVQGATGTSGFDPGLRAGGPKISLPATGAPQPTNAANGPSSVGSLSGK